MMVIILIFLGRKIVHQKLHIDSLNSRIVHYNKASATMAYDLDQYKNAMNLFESVMYNNPYIGIFAQRVFSEIIETKQRINDQKFETLYTSKQIVQEGKDKIFYHDFIAALRVKLIAKKVHPIKVLMFDCYMNDNIFIYIYP